MPIRLLDMKIALDFWF